MKQRAEKLLRRLEAEALLKTTAETRLLQVKLDTSNSTDKFEYHIYSNNWRVSTYLGQVPHWLDYLNLRKSYYTKWNSIWVRF